LFFLNLAHFLDHYFLLIFPTAVIAMHVQWELSYADALTYGTATFIAFAIGTLPAGWLGDRWSREGMIAIFFLGIGLASVLAGFAQGPISLVAGLAVLGLFASIFHPVGLALVTEATDRPGHAMAVNGVWGNMGLAAAALATGFLADTFTWRIAFIAPGLVSMAIGAAYFTVQMRARAHGPRHAKITVPLLPATRSEMLRVFALIAVSALFGGLIFTGVTVSLPKLFEERLADVASGLTEVGLAASIVFALAAFAQLPVGRLLDRFGAKPILITVLALEGAFLFIVGQVSGVETFVAAIPLLLLIFGALPITGWLMARYVASAWRARAFACEYVLSLGVGSLAVPMISFMHANGGFARLFTVLAVFALVVLAAAFVLPGLRRTAEVVAAE
jgi:MFS family permease